MRIIGTVSILRCVSTLKDMNVGASGFIHAFGEIYFSEENFAVNKHIHVSYRDLEELHSTYQSTPWIKVTRNKEGFEKDSFTFDFTVCTYMKKFHVPETQAFDIKRLKSNPNFLVIPWVTKVDFLKYSDIEDDYIVKYEDASDTEELVSVEGGLLENLEIQLQEALDAQNYEKAAGLRDEINREREKEN